MIVEIGKKYLFKYLVDGEPRETIGVVREVYWVKRSAIIRLDNGKSVEYDQDENPQTVSILPSIDGVAVVKGIEAKGDAGL